jgi:hypothetical protein
MVKVAHHSQVAILDEFYALETPYTFPHRRGDAGNSRHPDIVHPRIDVEPLNAQRRLPQAQAARVADPVSERGKEKQ